MMVAAGPWRCFVISVLASLGRGREKCSSFAFTVMDTNFGARAVLCSPASLEPRSPRLLN
ncbi:hypothetical protein E2C01_082737 [Portunus trituberculatus]|uniref:Uncharacterized protein n=1 Tax=Portunus trituberculatus TaxID=210409 RepID=A0A5B7J4J7_PORTR|nr:hypothetical protein [Portunus trituberculatus]